MESNLYLVRKCGKNFISWVFWQPPEHFENHLHIFFLPSEILSDTTAWLETVPSAHTYHYFTSCFVMLKELLLEQ